jgi:hypothetical protein
MTDQTTKLRALSLACLALYGPLLGPWIAWSAWVLHG